MSDERIEAAMTREEMIAHAAYHIDKHCTGGTDEDWDAAEQIIKDLVDPLLDRLRDARSEDEPLRAGEPVPHEVFERLLRDCEELRRERNEWMEEALAARVPQGEDHEEKP